MLLSLSMLLKVSNLTPLHPSIHTRSRCHVANGDVATNNWQSMTNYSQPGEPSDCPPPLIFSHEKKVPHQLMMEQNVGQQQHGTSKMWQGHDNLTSDHNDDTGNMTLQLLLPCQLTCALHSRGINVTLGCTLHGFLTHETPCTPLPVPTDYPDPCRGYGFLEGMGIGHHKVTWGLPMPITNSQWFECWRTSRFWKIRNPKSDFQFSHLRSMPPMHRIDTFSCLSHSRVQVHHWAECDHLPVVSVHLG